MDDKGKTGSRHTYKWPEVEEGCPAAAWTDGCSGPRRENWPPIFETLVERSTAEVADQPAHPYSEGKSRLRIRRHALYFQPARIFLWKQEKKQNC